MQALINLKYLIPSLISLASLWFAIRAMLAINIVAGAWELLCCVVLDKLDGTAARTLKATSRFGMKLDSMVDAVAFGIVPGVLLIQYRDLFGEGLWQGLAVACGIIYMVATFYRLYKFDKLATSAKAPDCFYGIPSTLAAGIFASYVVAFLRRPDEQGLMVLLLVTLALAFLMNGNFPTLKVGKPESRAKLLSQIAFFLFVSWAIFSQKLPQVLFGISLCVLYVTIYYGGKKFGRRQAIS